MLPEAVRNAIFWAADAVFGPWTIALLFGTGIFLTVRLRFVQVRRFGDGLRTLDPRGPGGRARAADPVPGLHDRAGRVHRHRQHRRGGHRDRRAAGRARSSGSGPTASSPPRSSSARPCWASSSASWRATACPRARCTTCATGLRLAEARPGPTRSSPGIAALTTTPFTQPNSIAVAQQSVFGIPTWVSGVVIAVLAWLVIIGGIKSIGRAAEKLAPLKVGLYLAGRPVRDRHPRRQHPRGLRAHLPRGLLDPGRGRRRGRHRDDERHALRPRPRHLRQRGRATARPPWPTAPRRAASPCSRA